ncbi:MAG: diadenylate cyclase CdaA [Candidatus Ornithospirochaeta sp.]|nr:diadenylate cyclase CdaA [Sphaerochaetaceae bacterium]MDY5522737.1 diadenylate cyclase CdaA [Candidatus Ornithospirochaeta sp.]
MSELFSSLSSADYLKMMAETAILTYIIYKLYVAVAETRAKEIAVFLLGVVVLYGFSYVLDLKVILTLLKFLLVPIVMFLGVFYAPELRRSFSGSRRRGIFRSSQTSASQLDSVLNACANLVTKKRGALIIFPRHTDLKSIYETGTKLNADLSANLILTIFDHDTPLHDGACVIQGGKCTYAACYLPLSKQTSIQDTFGTRHRAALGLSEESDAVILIVSEETGAISLAYNANIYYDLDTDRIKSMLIMLLSGKDMALTEIQKSDSSQKEDDNADKE